jgi:hypothetical protein
MTLFRGGGGLRKVFFLALSAPHRYYVVLVQGTLTEREGSVPLRLTSLLRPLALLKNVVITRRSIVLIPFT